MKYAIALLFFIAAIGSSCSRDVTTIAIVRNPVIKFSIDSATWQADSYYFLPQIKVVEYPADTSHPAVLYNRFTLQATGKDSKGNSLQFTLMFDAADNMQLSGLYKPRYTATKGLGQVQVYNLTNSNLATYSVCDTTFSFMQIKKQSLTERLIAGSFQAKLCNDRDPAKTITISNGTFTDINYK